MALRARIVLLAARCAAGEGGRAKAGGTDHAEQARGGHALTLRELASKAGISDDTARAVEAGNLQTGLGANLAMLWAMGLVSEIQAFVDPERDDEGKQLEMTRLPQRVRHRKEQLDGEF